MGDRGFRVIHLLGILRPHTVREIEISIDDKQAVLMRDFANEHPGDALGEEIKPITDGQVALAKFPMSNITMVRKYEKAWDGGLLTDTDLTSSDGRALEAVKIFAGSEWNAGVVLDGDRIVTIRFIKAIPPPF